jgi:metacaspase-1
MILGREELAVTKKALCVGTNHYDIPGAELRGCVRDAQDWAALFIDHYDFPRANVRLLTDQQATKRQTFDALKSLLAGSTKGDTLVYTNSSHGTYDADISQDEPDRYDEAICPYDVRESLLTDDELRDLFAGIPKGVKATIISDSCFSGTVSRVVVAENFPGWLALADDRRVKFLHPALRGQPTLANPWAATRTAALKYPQSSMTHLLISGSTHLEYSYDAMIAGGYHGACTYFLIRAIEQAHYRLTYRQLITAVNSLLKQTGYPQHPQLEGPAAWKRRLVFA